MQALALVRRGADRTSTATSVECAVEVCGGFWWLRASAAGEALLDGMFAQSQVMRKQDERIGEQPVLNFVLHRTPGLRWRVLPRDEYPNGASYFVRRKWPAALPVIVHNNWLAGYKKKRARFERHGMWLLGPATRPTASRRRSRRRPGAV